MNYVTKRGVVKLSPSSCNAMTLMGLQPLRWIMMRHNISLLNTTPDPKRDGSFGCRLATRWAWTVTYMYKQLICLAKSLSNQKYTWQMALQGQILYKVEFGEELSLGQKGSRKMSASLFASELTFGMKKRIKPQPHPSWSDLSISL